MLNVSHKTPSIIGGILLVVGNVVGAGILALPIAISQFGLPLAILVLVFFWLLVMLGAYYYLEANLAFPAGANLVSMSRATLGKVGVPIAWISNFLVLFSAISAYMAGGGDLIKTNFHYIGLSIPSWMSTVIFLSLFGFIVSRGIHMTDHANRLLMSIKGIIFFVILLGLSSHFNVNIATYTPQQHLSSSLFIIVLSAFGFSTLIPSLRSYYQSDVKKLKSILFWGTFIPLICYVSWCTLIFSVIPYQGTYGLEYISKSAHPLSDLQFALTQSLHISWITQATNLFSLICIITSFLANSISLTDFIADGLNLQHNHKKSVWVYFLAYVPALLTVLFFSKAFLIGLAVSGTFAIIQSLIVPVFIVMSLRYRSASSKLTYSVFGGKPLLVLLLLMSLVLFILTM